MKRLVLISNWKQIALAILLLLITCFTINCFTAVPGQVKRSYEYEEVREDGTKITYKETVTYNDNDIDEEDAPLILNTAEKIKQ